MAITASEAKDFVVCPRKVYLNLYGPQERKLPYSEFMLRKAEEGKEFEARVAAKMPHVKPKYRAGDLSKGAESTLKLMKKGAGCIYQGVLSYRDMLGIPDFLQKSGGKSAFGDFIYSVAEIKTGLSVKEKYLAQLMFYAYLVSKVQGTAPSKACLILGDESRHEVDVKKHMKWFMEKLEGLRKVAAGMEVEPSRVAGCPNCPWYDVCFKILLKKQDLSLLYKLTRKAHDELKKKGIKDLNDVAYMDAAKTAKSTGLGESRLKKWKSQAKSWVNNKPVVVKKVRFPKAETEIFLDFESEDDTHYLIGLIARKKKEVLKQFFAQKRKDEEKVWREFLRFLSKERDFAIYHYGSYERKAFGQLISRYGISKKLEEKLFSSMFDLLKVFYENVMLPTWTYSLKHVARYIGFEWRNPKASGELSMLWYDSYVKTKDKKFATMIKEYNEDDLIATRLVKDWLDEVASQ